jgi:heme exporter protein D
MHFDDTSFLWFILGYSIGGLVVSLVSSLVARKRLLESKAIEQGRLVERIEVANLSARTNSKRGSHG